MLEQESYIGYLRTFDSSVSLGGDERANSPGHSAKYGTYTMMSLDLNAVIDLQLVTSNEVKGSSNMEKEGFVRSFTKISERLSISKSISDRHLSIHLFDIWHVARGLSRKLEAASKLRNCECIRAWIQSISNHLYWSAVSSPEGEGELIVAKWKSILNHIHNVHTGHDDARFPSCAHDELTGRERRKQWIKPRSHASVKL